MSKAWHTFKDAKSLESWLRTVYNTHFKEPGYSLDYIKVGGKLYTMISYDWGGQEITLGNRRAGKLLHIVTANRYSLGYSDAEVLEDHISEAFLDWTDRLALAAA